MPPRQTLSFKTATMQAGPHLMRRQALQNLPVAEWQREQSVLPAGVGMEG